MVVISEILSEDFDFTNLLWVFSGRRGIHAWVCDEGAREMNNEMRSAVVQYCNIGVGNENTQLKLQYPLHPRLRKVYKYLLTKFEEVAIMDHDILTIEKHRERFVEFLPPDHRSMMKTKWHNMKGSSGMELWECFKETYATLKEGNKVKKEDLTLENLVMTYLYPRIDANVSTGINHLLKSPWCIHPKTGKICVPIDPRRPDDFKCDDVPTLTMVINELGEIGKDAETLKEDGDSVTTPCMQPFMKTFKEFLKASQRK
jgi:DNA primase small subunit